MDDLTGTQIFERREALETASANLLGRLLFAFSRLDTNLGLCLVWIGGGAQLEALSQKVPNLGFSKRLESLEGAVKAALEPGSKGYSGYTDWLSEAHKARMVRNELVHGRWGVDAQRYEVINIVGIPTSSEQREVRYTLAELEGHVLEVRRLDAALGKLRDRWPL